MSSFGTWSAYGPFGRAVKIAFFATLLLLATSSVFVLTYGLWLIQTRSQYVDLFEPTLYVDVARIMVVISTFAFTNAIVCLYAVLKELRCIIYSCAIASMVICLMLIIGGIMGFVFVHNLRYQIPLHLKMLTSLRELYGTREMDGVTNAWDQLQANFECCGVNSTDDYRVWRTSKWYMRQKEPKQLLPFSCCLKGTEMKCQKLKLKEVDKSVVHTKTCYFLLKSDLLHVMDTAACILTIYGSFMLFPASLSAVYACLIRK